MGSGIDMARADNPELAQALENMRDQLLIVFLERLGGKVVVPVAEVDGTGRYFMEMVVDQDGQAFSFELRKKS